MISILQNAPIYIVPFLLVISVIITIHELGHFLTARAFKVAVDRFSLGFGPTIASWRDRGGVEWRVGALPLGGYVRFAGDDNAASIPDGDDLEVMRAHIVAREGVGAEKKYLHFKPLWQRALIVAAGPLANFALAIVLFALFFAIFGEQVTTSRVSAVAPGSAAQKGGFQAGDVVRAADGHAITSFEDLQFYVQYRANVPIDFTVERGAQTVHLAATPAAVSDQDTGGRPIGRLGLEAHGTRLVRHGPVETVGLAVKRTYEVAATTLYYLSRIVTGHVPSNQIGSFIGIAHQTGDMTRRAIDTAHEDHVNVAVSLAFTAMQLTAFLSISVGLLNLMPVPVLDGGHLLFYAYESVARRPLSANIQAAGYRVGLALLLGLMLFATWNDLQGLRVFHFLGGLIS
ncbi:M50 family metallopeptidase [Caulobacter sp. KR2-114]|uniref:M50 family metallopeptidase n=1 Tax=Caulobacter sp. KR2-114 TaxID=3400912 RepID=UPI003BFB2A69